ncbi:PAAR domain-containing protein [Pseudomonas gingeri]|uniref:PAAR domain-containing protein n=1 Tax=Pseudomonas gingeri TaxID=117681 RepID=A0A7Y7YF28_9PSED|nr:PAAR domain-containing protein [Pseudomonas gingeri]NWA04939.1 PAAR domain-containing protein [Pseudomonas gingeri]NWA17439.1 PAAR domain-containing protein [Pseudomonas gingeri]NWA58722.1 PAAR domain-containing protein [Pseudomonas gingeri]NWA97001.1 PAAR domain-containing protein [Pseudomonas gingeri]NWB05467.1 PAAR domain-containing protein [Pseudomonas gingeri]
MDVLAAARLGDEIAHGFGVAAMVAGAVAGALIGAAVVAATVATGGAALAIMAGSIAAGGLSMFQIIKGLNTIFNLPEPTTGALIMGSLNVYINTRNAMRAGIDVCAACSGLPMNHSTWPFPVLIAEGSASVYINGKPAARLQSKMVCGAHIKSGSPNTFIGGPTVAVAFVLDLESWMHTGLEALGLVALGAAAVLAAMAGAAAFAGFVVIGGAMMGGMALLGDLGDRLGPGYRDLLQGVAGMALLGLGPKMARIGKTPEPRVASYKPGMTDADIMAIPKGSRPPPGDYLEGPYIDKHLKTFEDEGGSFLFTADDIANPKYTSFNPNKFVMARSDLEGVVAQYQKTGDVSVLESALGYDPGSLAGKDIYMMNLDNPKVLMPTGNEGGVNSLWRPGGLTHPGGMREAVLDNVPISHGNDIDALMATRDVVRIQ